MKKFEKGGGVRVSTAIPFLADFRGKIAKRRKKGGRKMGGGKKCKLDGKSMRKGCQNGSENRRLFQPSRKKARRLKSTCFTVKNEVSEVSKSAFFLT